MQQDSTPMPVRGALYYTAKMLLLVTIGSALQRALGSAGAAANQLLLTLGLAVGFALYSHQGAEPFRLRRPSLSEIGTSVLLGISALALIQVLGAIASIFVDRAGGEIPQYYNFTETPFLVALVTHALLPAVCEELGYRGYLQSALGPLGPRAAVVVTALLFGATHFSLIRLVPLVLLGLILGTAVQRSGSVYTAVIMHLVNNATVLGLTYYGSGIPSVSALGLPVLLGLAAVLGAVTWGLVRAFGPAQSQATAGTTPLPGITAKAVAVVLLPALLLYAYAVSTELTMVFGG